VGGIAGADSPSKGRTIIRLALQASLLPPESDRLASLQDVDAERDWRNQGDYTHNRVNPAAEARAILGQLVA